MTPFDPEKFHDEALTPNGIDSIFGVPDSSLSGLLSYLAANKPKPQHVVMANEGGAVALAAGHYLATRRVAMCYLQNSGLSNALNPLQSLAAKEVFGIPMLLMIGWRGKPGIKDEPQHALIGPRLLDNLRANDIPFEELPESIQQSKEAIGRLISKALAEKTPVALIVPPGAFTPYTKGATITAVGGCEKRVHVEAERWFTPESELQLSREIVVRRVLAHMKEADVSVSSLGGTSRELYMVRKERGESLSSNFFCLGAMGHSFAVANGIRLRRATGRVFCIDGDGSFVMHLGNNAVLADISQPNLVHVVVFNGVHSSTGNQPLTISREAFLAAANGLSYERKFFVDNAEALDRALGMLDGRSTLILVLANESASASLPRPSETARELKDVFMGFFS
ncbi:Taurine dioxygenase [Purpureocillium takamizusanense]|uniref:Taurine dioxygenase n=1 Tax=Purpureocillium takamizusanense TaxID=2060973 RepID=A0A9Q8Q602_9HYPO|nr:Taurine dioxygenase [Purpureocillium takamizusanense]UNI13680.1 Taurine dioxygenase [Purpureocillium takamizusanense]